MTSPMTATSDNNNSAGVGFEVKLPRPCRRTTSKTSILEGTDRRESSTLVSHELASRVGPETDEGFVCLQQDGASSGHTEGKRKNGTVAVTTSGSSIGSETNSTGSKTSTSSIQSAESGVFCGPSDRVRPKPEEESVAAPTSSEIRRAHKMRRQTGGYIRPKQQPAPTTTTIIPEEEGLLAPVAQPEDFMGTVEMGEAASMLPPPLISVSGEETPDIYSGGTVENFPLGPSGGNICSTPIAYAESTESLNRRPSFLDRSSEWLNKKLSPDRKRRPSDAHIATLTPVGRPTLVKPKQASSRLSKATVKRHPSVEDFPSLASNGRHCAISRQASVQSEQVTCSGDRIQTSSSQKRLTVHSISSAGSSRSSLSSLAAPLASTTETPYLQGASKAGYPLDNSSVAGATADSTLELRDLTDNNFLNSNSSLHTFDSSHNFQDSSTYATIDNRLVTRHKRASDPQKANLLKCIRKFNENPTAGVQLLGQLGILDDTDPEQIAQFLIEGRLSKKKVGEYLGDRHDLNQEVLKCFIKNERHQCANIILVEALRQFLYSFRLPGEAQQIDRIMECFAKHYCSQNPGLFDETDTCYIVCFGITMLNTVLHNPAVKHKTTEEQFISQFRGMNSGKDLKRSFLEQIYRTIRDQPFVIPEESYDDILLTFFAPEMEGYLYKQGGSWKSWHRRWFAVTNRCLYYFQDNVESKPKGIVPLENVKVREIGEKDGKSHCFEIYTEGEGFVKGCRTDPSGTVVLATHKSYVLSADSAQKCSDWLTVIEESIKQNDPAIDHFHKVIEAKKSALRPKGHRTHTDVALT